LSLFDGLSLKVFNAQIISVFDLLHPSGFPEPPAMMRFLDKEWAEAIEWAIRVQHPDFADWDALAVWLADKPDNAEKFHRLTLAEDKVVRAICARDGQGG
jgi:hypothetical protein